jgi:hypothetical protein
MISFSFPSCPLKLLKLTGKPEFASRSSRCPTCKQPLTVPRLDMTPGATASAEANRDGKIGIRRSLSVNQFSSGLERRR